MDEIKSFDLGEFDGLFNIKETMERTHKMVKKWQSRYPEGSTIWQQYEEFLKAGQEVLDIMTEKPDGNSVENESDKA